MSTKQPFDRRTVLGAGMGGLVGMTVLESGCATASGSRGPGPAALDPGAAEAAIARIDERMASFESADADLPAGPHHLRAEMEARVALARKTARCMYLAGAFQQLDEEVRYHPGVQARVRRMQGEMDEVVEGVTRHLASLSPEERRRLQQRLASNPELAPSLAKHVQEVAREDGFRFGERAHLRFTFTDLDRQLRAQHPSAVIDRSVRKARAMRDRAASLDERAFAALVGEGEFRQLKERAIRSVASWEHVYASRPRIDLARLDELYPDTGGGAGVADQRPDAGVLPEEKEQPSAGGTVLTVGAWMLGIGAVVEGAGIAIFAASASAGLSSLGAQIGTVMCLFIGPALLGLGLIVLIVGGVMMLAAPRPGETPKATAPARPPPPPAGQPAPPTPASPEAPPATTPQI